VPFFDGNQRNRHERIGVLEIVPVTPFHFGPGVLLKAVAPQRTSLTAFMAAQVAIDVESAYHLYRVEWPVHREIHSLALATVAGTLAVMFLGRHVRLSDGAFLRAEILPGPALLGGLLGGLSHPLLDAIMHSDLRPFWPFSDGNPFLDLVKLPTLHVVCIASGVLGIAVIAARLRWWRGAR
jgi:membrane-bound metal-dependent hydrolase YbcI (DUF457 family)